MKAIEKTVEQMKENPKDVRFNELCKVCDYYFGEARAKGSHRIYRTPWQGDPRIKFRTKGKAKATGKRY
jgi:hypothetical protein